MLVTNVRSWKPWGSHPASGCDAIGTVPPKDEDSLDSDVAFIQRWKASPPATA